MQAIILAAGYGRRMRPLTDSEHKALLRIGGQAIIDRMVNGLVANGITKIIVATGYLARRLESHLKSTHPMVEFRFVENPSYDTTNNIHSLARVLKEVEIDEDVLLIESDLIYEPSVITRIIKSSAENVALVAKHRRGLDGTVVTVSNGVITSIIPPHLQDADFNFTDKYKTLNIYKFSAEFCNHSLERLLDYYTSVFDHNAYYELVLGMLIYIQKATIRAEIIDGEKWAEVDDPNDLDVANFIFNDGPARYAALEAASGGYWNFDVLDFSFIRNMHFPTAAVLSELKTGLGTLLTQYGSRQSVLDQKLAYFLLCRPENVCLLNGCSQVYPMLERYFAGRQVLVPAPTFGEYERAFPRARSYPDRVGLDSREIEGHAREADVVVFVNPNNPTGSLLPSEWIYDYADRNPSKAVIVDESFIDFAEVPSLLGLLEQKPLDNVIVLKSLSKPLGIPGLRLGFAYSSNPAFNEFVRQGLPIWNCNSLAEHFLELILKHREALARSFAATAADREQLAAQLAEVPGIETVYPSAANFILVRLDERSRGRKSLATALLAHSSIYVKDVSRKFADGRAYARLAVRLPDENAALVGALRATLP